MFAIANINGGPLNPNLNGVAYFMDVPGGTDVYVEVKGLPIYKPGTDKTQPIGPHGFHIHETGICRVDDGKNQFSSAGGHFNPTKQPHGNHAGDFPVLFSNNGYARTIFFTNKFNVSEIIGRAVIIHENPDDYRTEPAGASGKRIACGIIKKTHSTTYPNNPYI